MERKWNYRNYNTHYSNLDLLSNFNSEFFKCFTEKLLILRSIIFLLAQQYIRKLVSLSNFSIKYFISNKMNFSNCIIFDFYFRTVHFISLLSPFFFSLLSASVKNKVNLFQPPLDFPSGTNRKRQRGLFSAWNSLKMTSRDIQSWS